MNSTISVDSYLELFTTMYGWGFAAIFKDILIGTGLVFLPFIVLVLGTWMESHKSASFEGADAGWMIRVMEIELGTAIFVMAFCFSTTSFLSLNQVNLRYVPETTAVSASPGPVSSSQAGTYSQAFSGAKPSIEVPLWWFTIMGLSAGINEAGRAAIGNDMKGFRELESMVRMGTIDNPARRYEINRFMDECFTPARSKFLTNASVISGAGQQALSKYGQADTAWPGSHFFQVEPGYYDSLTAQSGVPGYALDPVTDADTYGTANAPAYGRPFCNTWWATLRGQIADEYVTYMKGNLSGPADLIRISALVVRVASNSPADDLTDRIVKMAIDKQRPTFVDTTATLGDARAWYQRWLQKPADALGGIGAAKESLDAAAAKFPVKMFASMAQALVLMAIYSFLPLIVVISRYSLTVMFAGALAIFTVKLWSLMWFIARSLDDHLIEAMYPDNTTLFGQFLTLGDAGGIDGAVKRMVLNTLLVGLYIGLPLIWSGMMGWVGMNLMRGIEHVKQSAIDAGNSSGKGGIGIATMIVTKGRTGGKRK